MRAIWSDLKNLIEVTIKIGNDGVVHGPPRHIGAGTSSCYRQVRVLSLVVFNILYHRLNVFSVLGERYQLRLYLEQTGVVAIRFQRFWRVFYFPFKDLLEIRFKIHIISIIVIRGDYHFLLIEIMQVGSHKRKLGFDPQFCYGGYF
jgi:hypothetical protein